MTSYCIVSHLASFIESASESDDSRRRGNNHLEVALGEWFVDNSVTVFRHEFLPHQRAAQIESPKAHSSTSMHTVNDVEFATKELHFHARTGFAPKFGGI